MLLVDALHPVAKRLQGEGVKLIGIGEVIPLSGDLCDTTLGPTDASFVLGDGRGGPGGPRAQLAGQSVGIEQQVPDSGPHRLVDPGRSQPIVPAPGRVRPALGSGAQRMPHR